MESQSGQFLPPFSPLLSYMPYNMFMNETNSLRIPHPYQVLPPSPHLPQPHQVSPLYAVQQASLFNMLAYEAAATGVSPHNNYNYHSLSPTSPMLMADSGEKIPRVNLVHLSTPVVCGSSPVTPPLTPLLPETAANTGTAGNSSATLQPTRTSSRNRRPPAFIEGQTACPICGSLLRASELEEHYRKELQSIKDENEISMVPNRRRSLRETRVSSRIQDKKSLVPLESRKNVFARVKHSRKSRVLKTGYGANKRKSTQEPSTSNNSEQPSTSGVNLASTSSTNINHSSTAKGGESSACPICNKAFLAESSEEMTLHVENCLKKNSTENGAISDSNHNSSESEEDYETYTWCGQTRIRATTMLDSDELANSGFNTVKKADDEDDTDLVVDDDMNEQKFGGAQYSEADVIPCTSEEPAEAKAQSALRQAVISNSKERKHSCLESQSKWTDEPTLDDGESLYKCLICMDKYSKPLVSVQCWHVHCEECWLRTLGAKKLCPQCNIITSPSDLRKIYL